MTIKIAILGVLNLALVVGFYLLLRKPGWLSYYQYGRGWHSRLSVAVITLMDKLTLVFFAPAGGNCPIVIALALT